MKILTTIIAMLLSVTTVFAQDVNGEDDQATVTEGQSEEPVTKYKEDKYSKWDIDEDDDYMFNHLSVGITLGTPGAGLDLAMPLGRYVQVRAGATYMPKFSFNANLPVYPVDQGYYNHYKIKNKVNFINGKVLFDLYASKRLPLHLTLGAYFGPSKIIEITDNPEEGYEQDDYKAMYHHNQTNRENLANTWGPQLGNYALLPTQDGHIDSYIKTSWIRPYAGLGWGKAISERGFNFMVEAGVMWWNTPEVHSNTTFNGVNEDVKLEQKEVDGKGAFIAKQFSKWSLYPVINVRFGFNMF